MGRFVAAAALVLVFGACSVYGASDADSEAPPRTVDAGSDGGGEAATSQDAGGTNDAADSGSDAWTGPTVTISDTAVNEGSTATFTVALSSVLAQDVVIAWTRTNVTADAADFPDVPTDGNLTITAGMTSKTISVATNSDSYDEANETFTMTINIVAGAVEVGKGTATGTILDDDPLPTIILQAPAPTNEGSAIAGTTPFVFNVSLSAVSGRTITVQYATQDGTATSVGANKDYTAAAGTLTFNPGETAKQVTVNVVEDGSKEADETFSVLLSNPVNASIGASISVSATIKDDD